MRLFDPRFSTRRWLKVGLALAGFAAGAVFGIVLTRLGKLATGAPPATLSNYAWNAVVSGVIAGLVSPLVSWSALRRVPLWRTVAEPLGLAVAGGVTAVIVGVPVLVLILPPVGLALSFAWLERRYPEPRVPLAARDAASIASGGRTLLVTNADARSRSMVDRSGARTRDHES